MSHGDAPLLVEQSQIVMAHAWMVRTFVKHSPEAEDFPELMGVARTVFDVSRALETRVADPVGYFRMLGKKMRRLREATEQFAADAPRASTHTNFVQAVLSMRGCLAALDRLLAEARTIPASPAAAPETPDDEAAEEMEN